MIFKYLWKKQYVKIVAEKMEKLVKTFRNGNSVIYKTPLLSVELSFQLTFVNNKRDKNVTKPTLYEDYF